jgi:hypothetical protein
MEIFFNLIYIGLVIIVILYLLLNILIRKWHFIILYLLSLILLFLSEVIVYLRWSIREYSSIMLYLVITIFIFGIILLIFANKKIWSINNIKNKVLLFIYSIIYIGVGLVTCTIYYIKCAIDAIT